jgi:hypothetical protein
MSRVQRPSQKVVIFDPLSNESSEAPTTDAEENKRRQLKAEKEELKNKKAKKSKK